mgnify:CR=1 FL=1
MLAVTTRWLLSVTDSVKMCGSGDGNLSSHTQKKAQK